MLSYWSGFYDLGTEVSVWKVYYGDDAATYAERSSLPPAVPSVTPPTWRWARCSARTPWTWEVEVLLHPPLAASLAGYSHTRSGSKGEFDAAGFFAEQHPPARSNRFQCVLIG